MLESNENKIEKNETDQSELLILAYTLDLLYQTEPEKISTRMLERFHILSGSGTVDEMSEEQKSEFMKYCHSIEEKSRKKTQIESADSYLRLRVETLKNKNFY